MIRTASLPRGAPRLLAIAALALGLQACGSFPDEPYRERFADTWSEHRFKGIIAQEKDFSCGSTALMTVLYRAFGERDLPSRETIIDQMLKRAGLDREADVKERGFSFLDLQKQLAAMGYESKGLALPLETMLTVRAPAIVHLETPPTKHFVMWLGSARGRVLLADPKRGMVNYSVAEFVKEWTGKILLVARKGEAPPKRAKKAIRAQAAGADGARLAKIQNKGGFFVPSAARPDPALNQARGVPLP
jgi:predicted double-glycine peptidase